MSADLPARDARFTVAPNWAACSNLPPGHPQKRIEFFHRQMNEEINVLENAADSLWQFTEIEWPLRMSLARQCSDEARHAQSYRRMLEAAGGHVGQFPVLNFQYQTVAAIPDLIGRLAVQNRTFEADGLDAAVFGTAEARREGDEALAIVYETQQADEVMHVRFGNEAIRAAVGRDARSAMKLAMTLNAASGKFQAVFGARGTAVTRYGVDVVARREAGFAEQEIEVAVEQAEARRRRAAALASTPVEEGTPHGRS
jgi:uncharacterized ferritin-like protein (DUF455 family)